MSGKVDNGEHFDGLRQLMAEFPPLGDGASVDFLNLTQDGVAIPADYRRLLEVYGPGCFDEFLWVFAVGAENEHLDILAHTQEVRHILGRKDIPRLQDVLAEHGASVEDLVQWGVTDNADLLLWVANGPPDGWPTVIVQAGQLDVFVYAACSTDLVLDLLRGAVCPPFFPEGFPSDHPQFSVNPYG